MTARPSGTLTFLFTDIEGSSRRWEAQPEGMREALARHDALLRETVERHGGHVFKTVGDAVHAVFATAPDALRAAVEGQRALAEGGWGCAVRMALHTGTADERDGDYFGLALNRVARLRDAGHGGQVLLSAATHELVRERVPEGVELRDLGVHRLRDLAEPEHVYQAAVWGLPADFPALRLADDHPTNLPTALTSLVGREQEIADIIRLLARARLVTLTGPGGTGKTRLALAVAEQAQGRHADGVWFVDLSPVTDTSLVASGIAQPLGIREREGHSLGEALKAYLREKRLLLVLDNFEQVVEAAPLVRELLAASAGLTVLITSRSALRVSGEHEYAVPPLPVPDAVHLPTPDVLRQNPAVVLFEQRARAVRADFVVTDENVVAVADICARLDGLPLAIELAAARIRSLSPEAIRNRLDGRLKLLTGGPRDVSARQQTLRGTIQWSYDLLDRAERVLFRRLAVFAGGCTLEAAEAVCNADADLSLDVLDGLAALVEKSLLRQRDGPGGEPRFTMLQTVRDFATELLEASTEEDALRRRHATYFLALGEAAEVHFRGPDEHQWLAWLAVDYDNLRAALVWSVAKDDAEAAMRLAGALRNFWLARGLLTEGREWLERALALPGATSRTVARAKALSARGFLANGQDDQQTVRPSLEEALTISEELGDRAGMTTALWFLGLTLQKQGDIDAARRLLEQMLTLAREVGDQVATGDALRWLAVVAARDDDRVGARTLLEEGMMLARATGDRSGLAHALIVLGELARLDADFETTEAVNREAVALRRERGAGTTAIPLHNLAWALLNQGNAAAAAVNFTESLVLSRSQGQKSLAAMCLVGLAGVLGARGKLRQAVQLIGATEATFATIDGRLDPADQNDLDRTVASLRDMLDADTFSAAYEEGRALSLDEAVALALEQTTRADSGP